MIQGTLFQDAPLPKVINVASVPQRSPFRYPGGKTWLVPYVRRWLLSTQHLHPRTLFIEPFAGGGIISLTVVAERLAEHVVMVELDADVAAVWQTALDKETNEWLACRITSFEVSYDNVRAVLAETPRDTHERAFQTIVKNRMVHGGILAPGSGLIKQGENGRGLHSRWYPETLARRIRAIAAYRDRMTFIHGDGLELLAAYQKEISATFFIDPPYTVEGKGKKAGKRLYAHHTLDHPYLFLLAAQLHGDFLMTYDDASPVHTLAQQHGFATHAIPMKNTHHAKQDELLISRDLAWVSQP